MTGSPQPYDFGVQDYDYISLSHQIPSAVPGESPSIVFDGLMQKAVKGSPGARGAVTALCAAFPAGIPDLIWLYAFDHRRVYRGDHGIRFEIAEGKEDWLRLWAERWGRADRKDK